MKNARSWMLLTVLLATACKRVVLTPTHEPVGLPPPTKAVSPLPKSGYAIQVGAFARAENAARLSDALCAKGLEATHFQGEKALFRVRFGNFATKDEALVKALALQSAGVISEFYIVSPSKDVQVASPTQTAALRRQLVDTALAQLGVPYLWGGVDAKGFDCSGLTSMVYRLNGLLLPRSSGAQFEKGESVEMDALKPGDLVFFATRQPGYVSHVGIFIGEDTFVHAPSRGKLVTKTPLSNTYFAKRYMGGRNFLAEQ